MDEQHKARLVKQIRGLRLSQSDMNQARFAAQVIPANQGDMRRLLETALAVTYARPFTDGLSMSRKKWEPKPATERQIHKRLIELDRLGSYIPSRLHRNAAAPPESLLRTLTPEWAYRGRQRRPSRKPAIQS